MLDKLDDLRSRFEEVSTLITDPNVIADQQRFVRLTREYKELEDLMKARKEYADLLGNLEEGKNILLTESDPEMKEMAREEVSRCEARIPSLEEEIKLREAEDEFFSNITEKKSRIRKSVSKDDDFFAHTEAKRCTECSYLCLKCVDVCPNRANVALDMRSTGLFDDPFQILHLDAYCNECGNCATFCPHNGKPYKDKFTLFSLREDFENSTNSGFYYENDELYVRLDGKVTECTLTRDGEIDGDIPEEIKAMIEEVFLSYPYLLGAVEE